MLVDLIAGHEARFPGHLVPSWLPWEAVEINAAWFRAVVAFGGGVGRRDQRSGHRDPRAPLARHRPDWGRTRSRARPQPSVGAAPPAAVSRPGMPSLHDEQAATGNWHGFLGN